MLRQAEELVMEARLELIAREHKSMGAVLDKRTLHPLEEIQFQTKRSLRLEIEKRLQGRRGGRAETDIKSKANLAVEAFKEKGINITMLTGNYELEQKIWKNKSSKGTYAQRRHLHHPELDEFLNAMSSQQSIEYQNRISQKLVELVEKFRKECADLKVEMDLNGIFHPDANAQRVHCIYLMKLEKGITSANIEDPVLKQMYIEEYDRQCKQLDLQIKKQQMLKDLEDKETQNNAALKVRGAADGVNPAGSGGNDKSNLDSGRGDNPLSMMETTENQDTTVVDIDVLKAKIVKLKPFEEKIVTKRDLSKSKWLPKIPLHKGTSCENLKSGCRKQKLLCSNSSSKLSDSINKSKLDTMDLPSNKREETDSGDVNGHHGFGKATPSSPTKLFSKKLKHERMGYMDPRSVLGEEAAKLDSAEQHVARKSFDKNPLLDESLSKWMLTELQKAQIMKAYSGGISNGTTRPQMSSLVDDIPQNYVTPGCFSPQKVLPFDEFYTLIKDCPDGNGEEKAQEKLQQSPTKKVGKLSLEDNIASPNLKMTEGENGILSPLLSSPEPMNIVKHLMDKDKHFDAFLKMNEREQPSSKLLEKLNANITKPRRQRKVPQLGKEAVTLSNSRGQPSKMATKGFPNVFVPNSADSKDFVEAGKVTVGYSVNTLKDKDVGEIPDVIDRLLHDTKDGRRRKESIHGGHVDGGATDDAAMKFPYYISKARTGNTDSKVSKQDALSFVKAEFHNCLDDCMFNFDEHVEIDMQNKLLACWEALSAPMHDRLNFMDKYSSFAYAAEMSRAVDMWSEVAVLATFLVEVVSLNKKLEAGLMIFPVSGIAVIKQLIRKIHPLLAASAPCLIPAAILYDDQVQSVPLSVGAMMSTRDLINSVIATQNMKIEKTRGEGSSSDRNVLLSATDAEVVFADILSELSNSLISSLKRCHRELEDVIPYGNMSCKEWVISLPISRRSQGK